MISKIACGSNHLLLLTDDGQVYKCDYGSYRFYPMEFNKKVIDIACDCDYSLLLTADGYVYIHGYDENEDTIYDIPTLIDNICDVIQIAIYEESIFFLLRNGTVYQWLDRTSKIEILPNAYDIVQIIGGEDILSLPSNGIVSNIDNIVYMAYGGSYTLCLASDGTIYSYGSNNIHIPKIENTIHIAATSNMSIFLSSDGTILLSQEDGSTKHMNRKYKYVSTSYVDNVLFLAGNDEIHDLYDHHYTM